MEAAGDRDGGRGPWSWRRYRRVQPGSIRSSSTNVPSQERLYRSLVQGAIGVPSANRSDASSYTTGSSSGTIVSSGTYASIGTRLSCLSVASASVEAALHFDLEMHSDEDASSGEYTEDEQMKRIKSMVQEFFLGAPSSADCGVNGDMSVLERWFAEMGVGWVLHLTADGASAGGEGELEQAFDARVRSWIQGLSGIKKAIRATASLLPDHGSVVLLLPSIFEEEQEPEADQLQFTRFIQETMLQMLPFVDAVLVALDTNITRQIFIANNGVLPALYKKISVLLRVCGALSEALPNIEVLFLSTTSAQVTRIRSEVASLLSAKVGKVTEAIWGTLDWVWARIMESMEEEDSSHTRTPNGESPDIHKATRSVTSHIRYLWDNYWSVTPIAFDAASQSLNKYVTKIEIRDTTNNPLASLTIHMLSRLQEKLAERSRSFPDQGLRLLFLINNSRYISQQLHTTYRIFLRSYFADLTCKIEGHIQTYLQVSWTPLLSCLSTPTPRFFGKNYDCRLPNFESELQKTYATQKFWKVPDPELRQTLRKCITELVIPGYTKYIEDNKVTAPKFTPQELEEMLQELFEG